MRRTRDSRVKRAWRTGALAAFVLAAGAASAETPITLLDQHVGRTNYVATGGTFRTAPNTSNACSTSTTSTASVSGLPATATIRAVYLYWVGSGASVDATVSLNGTPVTAQRTDTATFPFNGTNYEFFSGFAEISAANIVNANGTYTLSGLSFATGNPYCSVQVVVGGWSLYVVYDDPNETLYAVNIFDGFQFFRGSAINLTASGFRIPANFIDGRFTFATYDGDPQNSGALNGFSESLSINGNVVDDGLVPPASSPTLQQYDGTINEQGILTSHGVDIDTYDVTPFLSPGDTTATVTMSAGGDLVLSTGMIIAVNSEPAADLSIAASHTDTFVAGQSASLLVDVANAGPEIDPTTIVVTTTLPPELVFDSASGSGWSCSASGQDITCTNAGPLAAGASLDQLVLLVDVQPAPGGPIGVTFDVTSASFDDDATNNQATDSITIVAPDLSASTKDVVDLNGGDAEPGDTLRYTITIVETGNVPAGAVSIVDDVPANVASFSIVAIPPGATDASSPIGGANGSGVVAVDDIAIAAGASVTVVFDAVIDAAAAPGDIVANTATISNPNGPGASPVAPNVIVSESQLSASGTKSLYLYDTVTPDPNGFGNGPAPYLSRTPPGAPQASVPVSKNQPPVVWRLTPALQGDLTIAAGTVPVTLNLSHQGGGGTRFRTLQVELRDSNGLIGAAVQQSFSAPPIASPATLIFAIPLAADRTIAAGETLTLTLTNVTPGGNTRQIRVHPISGGSFSRIDMTALTVINVDQIGFFDAAYAGGVAITEAAPGAVVSIRATISDPFGSFDITAARIDVDDPTATPVVSAQPMTRIVDSGAASAQFEYLFTIPAAGPDGAWTVRVTGVEGTEGLVTHARAAGLAVVTPLPQIVVDKVMLTESDPVGGAANPFNIPGAIALYTVTVTNTGPGSPDAGSLQVVDALPSQTSFVVAGPGDPVALADGSDPSGLVLDYATGVFFSSQPGGGAPYDYTPVAGADGTDPLVTGIAIRPGGTMNPAVGGAQPSFSAEFRLRLRD